MPELKTRPTTDSVAAFLGSITDPARRADCESIADMMRAVTQAEPRMWGPGMVGFGSYHYRYDSGREGDWFLTGFAPRKNELVLYIMAGFADHEELLAHLGRHRKGKSCLYIKRLADVDKKVLRRLVTASVRHIQTTYPD